jgi:phosphoribosylaminoimidazole-succinocarboxamide synthase
MSEPAPTFGLPHVYSGKVRDIYEDGDDLILVASDRISVYDTVLPTPIPDKGRILTALSLWWFERLTDLVPNHVVSSTDVPSAFAGRAIRCRRLEMVQVECVARGYLAGSSLTSYTSTGTVCGVALPPGLVDGSRLPEPIFTPTTKASVGEHDEPITYDDVVAKVGAETAAELRRIIIADTKIELGFAPDGTLVLGDEVLTPDSSRFWPAEAWEPGRSQYAFDKQYVRDWAASSGWDKQPPAPVIPPHVVEATRLRYIEAYERLTGESWA